MILIGRDRAMRRFQFEADIYETLSCVPMMVRAKLDRVAIKVSLQQWLALDLTGRRLICEAPVETTQQCLDFAGLIKGPVRMRSANEPATLSMEQQRAGQRNCPRLSR
jgi:hypothetical protein